MSFQMRINEPSEAAAKTARALNALLEAVARLADASDDRALKYAEAFIALARATGARVATDAEVTARARASSGATGDEPEKRQSNGEIEIGKIVNDHQRQRLPYEACYDAVWKLGHESARRDIDSTKAANAELLKMYDELLARVRQLNNELTTITDDRNAKRAHAESMVLRLQQQSDVIVQLTAELADSRAAHRELESKLALLQAELQQARGERNSAQQFNRQFVDALSHVRRLRGIRRIGSVYDLPGAVDALVTLLAEQLGP